MASSFTLTVEVTPPKGIDLERLFAEVKKLSPHVAAVNVTDCPLGRLKMSSIPAAALIKSQFQVDTIFNFTCRDRTALGLQADLLGAQALKLDNVLALTGDAPDPSQPGAGPGIFQLNSLGLVKIIAGLNQGIDFYGQPLESRTDFFIGVASNPGAEDQDGELARLEGKVREGAHFLFTQPAYQGREARQFLKRARGLGIPVLFGLMPLKSAALADYLNKSVPGITVPDQVMARMARGSKQEQRQTGAAIALELVQQVADEVNGIHLMPAGDLELTQEILAGIERHL